MSPHILIIDDDLQIRSVLRIALKQAAMASSEAGTRAEGLAKARSGRFDLIVLDIGLPEMDGLEVCRTSRASDDTSVMICTRPALNWRKAPPRKGRRFCNCTGAAGCCGCKTTARVLPLAIRPASSTRSLPPPAHRVALARG